MNKRNRLLLVFVGGLALMLALSGLMPPGASPAQAGGSWSAWLYNDDTGDLVQVFPDGAPGMIRSYPMAPGMISHPQTITMSRDGTKVAGCQEVYGGGHAVYVMDLATGAMDASFGFSGSIVECLVSRYSFSPDGSQIAFGVLNHYPDPADPRPDWVIYVVDIATSMPVYQLTSADPAVTALGLPMDGRLPMVRAYETGVIAFAPVMWGTEGAPEYPSLVWQLAAGTVTEVGPYGKSSLDLHHDTGEAIWIEQRSDFPTGFLDGPGHLFNVAMYSNKAGAWYPFFHLAGAVVEGTSMIYGGSMAAVRTYTHPGPAQWWYVDRTGAVGTLSAPSNVYQLWGVNDGYIYMDPSGSPVGGQMLVYHRFTTGGISVQNLWTGDPSSYWRIVYVTPLYGGAGLAPFPSILPSGGSLPVVTLPPAAVTLVPPPVLVTLPPAVVTLVPPVAGFTLVPPAGGFTLVPPSVPIVTLPPAIEIPPIQIDPSVLTLTLGNLAQVRTTEGDMLRVRSGPDTGYGVSFQLAAGTPVTVVDGPRESGGYTWWYIQTADGRAGWAVDGVPDDANGWLNTLIPLQQ